MRMKRPYSEYFKKCSFKDWSFDHFKSWCVINNRCCASNDKFDIENHSKFIDKIRKIKNAPGTLKEIRYVLSDVSLILTYLIIISNQEYNTMISFLL